MSTPAAMDSQIQAFCKDTCVCIYGHSELHKSFKMIVQVMHV
jgi:hypothetical protein